jgi:hypothetical protein
MRKALLLLVVGLLVVPVSLASGSTASSLAPAKMFVGGGTPLTNGIFFPGVSVYDGEKLQGVPMEIQQGQDIELTNIDEGDVANCHQLTSYKRRRGQYLINSKRLCSPGETALVVTSHLKPGRYEAFCPIHTSMYAIIDVKA